jgi:hypothetical protein
LLTPVILFNCEQKSLLNFVSVELTHDSLVIGRQVTCRYKGRFQSQETTLYLAPTVALLVNPTIEPVAHYRKLVKEIYNA